MAGAQRLSAGVQADQAMAERREYPQQDSNLRTRLRRPVLYPLSYGGQLRADYTTTRSAGKKARKAVNGRMQVFTRPGIEKGRGWALPALPNSDPVGRQCIWLAPRIK